MSNCFPCGESDCSFCTEADDISEDLESQLARKDKVIEIMTKALTEIKYGRDIYMQEVADVALEKAKEVLNE